MQTKQLLNELRYWYPLWVAGPEAQAEAPEPWVVNYDHPAYIVDNIEKLTPCQNRKVAGWPGRNFWIWVEDLYCNVLPNVQLELSPAYGRGTISERALIWGMTDDKGWAEYVHPQIVTYYTISVGGIWIIDRLWTNNRPAYCDPASWPPGPEGTHGWRPAELPGDGSYHIHLQRRW